ncbi:unnamed protein product [Ectocarpus sp. 12 AP-2014]
MTSSNFALNSRSSFCASSTALGSAPAPALRKFCRRSCTLRKKPSNP